MNIFKYLIVAFLLVVIISILWRLGSKRYVLPCPSWLSWLVELDNPLAKENQAMIIVRRLQLQKGMAVADIGCGPGRLTIPLAHAVGPTGRVLAMDIQSEMLEKVKAKAHSIGNIEFLQSEIGNKKLEKNSYDRILLVNVLGEIPDPTLALQEIRDALKPDGIFSITETIFDPHFQRLGKVEELLGNLGFEKKQVFGKWFSYTAHFKVKRVRV